jgi:endogenous inhibitor of DNA gyrase (YacG/DUF329 family)
VIEVLCPSCRERTVSRATPTFPFCSSECRDRDLLGWVEERYRIPVAPVPNEEPLAADALDE